MLRKQLSLSLLTIAVILAAAIVTFTEIGKFSVAQGQSDITPSLTPQQKAAMCDPNNPKLNFVNGTESRICGIPKNNYKYDIIKYNNRSRRTTTTSNFYSTISSSSTIELSSYALLLLVPSYNNNKKLLLSYLLLHHFN
jgi:hypothetical protein